MNKKNIILIAIVILVIALAAVAAYIYSTDNTGMDITDKLTNNTSNKTIIDVDKVNNTTVVGDNSTRDNETADITNNNTTYKVYNPQSDSYVPVIGEEFDDEVNRWYTYDEDGVRYYNTRIN